MKLKSLLLGSAAGFVAIPGANAADLPLKAAAAPVAVPAASWQGWYAGIHLGAASVGGDSQAGWGDTYGSRDTVFIGGGQVGYNWQNGNFVYGWEADISGLTDYSVSGNWQGNHNSYANNISWLSTIRGRMGLAVGNTMAYATGGLAVGRVDNTQNYDGDNFYSSSKTRWGWAVGGGVEHMWNRNWTIGLEALYVNLGRYTGPCDGAEKCARYSNDAVIGRFKVNYKF